MKINNNKIKSLILLSLLGSGSAKEENSTNQSEIASNGINLNSLPQMATNLTKREDNPDQILVYAGLPIFFKASASGEDQEQCVANFALVDTRENDECMWPGGEIFLTSAQCCKQGTCGADHVFLVSDNSQQIGQVSETAFQGEADDYAVLMPNNQVNLIPFVVGPKELYPVTSLSTVTSLGTKVCAYGAISGYRCGKVVEINVSVGAGRDGLIFKEVNKVDLGANGFTNKELGSPVYVENKIGDRTIAQALGYITAINNDDSNHKLFYYTPLDKILAMFAELECYYTLKTYNEQFQDQIQVPPKDF
jgi:hypothetical protein